MQELYMHHLGEADGKKPARAVPAAARSPEKRRFGERCGGSRKVAKLMIPDSLRDDDGEIYSHEEPATKTLVDLLEQVKHDNALAATYWHDIMEQVRTETINVRAKGVLGQAPDGLIKCVLARMQGRVQDMIQSGLQGHAEGSDDKSQAELCLAVVQAALSFIADEELGPDLYNEDLMETIVTFVDMYYNKVIMPALERALKSHVAQEGYMAGSNRKSKGQVEKQTKKEEVHRTLKGKMQSITDVVLVLGDVLSLKVKVQDPQCLKLSSMCLGAFFVDFPAAVHHLQQACVGLMQAIFAGYPEQRESILQEIAVRACSWRPMPSKFCYVLKAPKLEKNIQMISALLLSLLQSCCNDKESPSSHHSAEKTEVKHPALKLLVMFLHNVQVRMQGKKLEKDKDPGYKLLFQSLVTDVCWVVGAPEWPIATLVLRALVKYTYDMCKEDTYPLPYRLEAARLLGNIVVRVKKLSLDAQPPDLKLLGGMPSGSGPIKEHPVVMRLIRQQEDVLNRCRSIMQQSPIDSAVSDEDVQTGQLALAQKLVSQQLLLNYLMARSGRDKDIGHAKQNWIWQWCTDTPSRVPTAASKCYEWFRNDDNYLAFDSIQGVDPTAHEACNYATFLCDAYDFEKTLNLLLMLLKHPKMIQFRSGALKALSEVIKLDPSTMSNAAVRDAVLGSMTDPAKSVRAQAVSLVGNMCKTQELILQYHEGICMRCRDSAPSVRKAALKILGDLFTTSRDKCVIDRVCVAIIPLLKDESEDTCKKTFALLSKVWFPSTTATSLGVTARFERVRGVVAAAHKNNTLVGRDSLTPIEILQGFLKDALKESERHRACEEYCKEALQAIIRSREKNISSTRGFVVGDQVESEYKKGVWRGAVIITVQEHGMYVLKWGEGPQDNNIKDQTQIRMLFPDNNLLSHFRTLALMARVRPELVVRDVEILCNFLSSQERVAGRWSTGVCEMMGTVASIYDSVLPNLQDPPDLLVKFLQKDLFTLIQCAPSMPLITIAIKCLCTLVKSVGNSRRRATGMYQVLQRCFMFHEKALMDPTFKQKPRSLIIAGIFCRFSDFKLHLDGGQQLAIDDHKVTEVFGMAVKQYAVHESLAFKRAGFSCLGSLFARQPRLIQQEDAHRVMNQAFDQDNEDIRSLAVQALIDFLGEDVADTNTTALRNATMQTYLAQILRSVFGQKEETAVMALRLVSIIHDRGQVAPQLIIPDMVAVQQRGVMCASVGYHVLKCIKEKYPEYISAEVFVQGVLKGHEHKRRDAVIETENFVRAFELRLPHKKYVLQTIKAVVDKLKRDVEIQSPSKSAAMSGVSSQVCSGGNRGATVGRGGKLERVMDDIDRKCFLLSFASMLPFPDDECAQEMIQYAAKVGIELGSETKEHLQMAMDLDGEHLILCEQMDDRVMYLIHKAACACLLLDIKGFLQMHYHNKKEKTQYPVEISAPLQPENILLHEQDVAAVKQVIRKLTIALSNAAEDRTVVAREKRGSGRPPKSAHKPTVTGAAVKSNPKDEWDSDEEDYEDEDRCLRAPTCTSACVPAPRAYLPCAW